MCIHRCHLSSTELAQWLTNDGSNTFFSLALTRAQEYLQGGPFVSLTYLSLFLLFSPTLTPLSFSVFHLFFSLFLSLCLFYFSLILEMVIIFSFCIPFYILPFSLSPPLFISLSLSLSLSFSLFLSLYFVVCLFLSLSVSFSIQKGLILYF